VGGEGRIWKNKATDDMAERLKDIQPEDYTGEVGTLGAWKKSNKMRVYYSCERLCHSST